MSESLTSQSDAELLKRFSKTRCERAFEELVDRYGRLVMSICSRALQNQHDAEDVFQATFLVLAKNVNKIRKRDSLPSWLSGVAFRLSMKLSRKRHRKDLTLNAEPEAAWDHFADLEQRFDEQAMDEELQSLPSKYRDVLVRFYFLGQTSRQIAEALRITQGAADGRIKRGRQELRVRLAKRGVALGAFTVTALSAQTSSAAVAPTLVQSTVAAAVAKGSVGLCSPSVVKLAGTELMKTSLLSPGLAMCAVVTLLGSAVLGLTGALAQASTQNASLNTIVPASENSVSPTSEFVQEPEQKEARPDELNEYELVIKEMSAKKVHQAFRKWKPDLKATLDEKKNVITIVDVTKEDNEAAVRLLGELHERYKVAQWAQRFGRQVAPRRVDGLPSSTPAAASKTPSDRALADLTFKKPKLSQDKKSLLIETTRKPAFGRTVVQDAVDKPRWVAMAPRKAATTRKLHRLNEIEVAAVDGTKATAEQLTAWLEQDRAVLVLYKGQRLTGLQKQVLKDSLLVVTLPEAKPVSRKAVGIDPAGNVLYSDPANPARLVNEKGQPVDDLGGVAAQIIQGVKRARKAADVARQAGAEFDAAREAAKKNGGK